MLIEGQVICTLHGPVSGPCSTRLWAWLFLHVAPQSGRGFHLLYIGFKPFNLFRDNLVRGQLVFGLLGPDIDLDAEFFQPLSSLDFIPDAYTNNIFIPEQLLLMLLFYLKNIPLHPPHLLPPFARTVRSREEKANGRDMGSGNLILRYDNKQGILNILDVIGDSMGTRPRKEQTHCHLINIGNERT